MKGKTAKNALLDWVDDQDDLPMAEKYTLDKLARYAGADGCAWALVETLASETNSSVRAVQYRLRSLEEAGKIRRTGRFYRLGTRNVPWYKIAPEDGEAGPETTVAAAGQGEASVGSMGANSAPMAGPDLHPYGCNSLHPHKEPTRTKLSEADASERRARGREAEAMRAAFDEALATYPDSGRGVTSEPEAWALWPEACAEVGGPAVLAATVAAFAADPSLKRRDFGAPSLQRFLRERRYRNWLPKVSTALAVANGVRAFDGPEAVRDQLVAVRGEAFTASHLDPATWNGTAVVAKTRLAAGRLREALPGVTVLDPPVGGLG